MPRESRTASEEMPTRALFGLALGNFAVGTGALVIAGVLPDIAQDLRVAPAAAGQLITVYAIAYAIGSPLLGSLAAGVERRRLLIGAALLYALANLLAAVAAGFDWLIVARILAAVGAALFSPTAAAVASTLVRPEQTARAIGMVFGGFVVSTVLGVPLGTWIGSSFGWPATFWFVATLTTGAALILGVTLPRGIRSRGAGLGALRRTLGHGRLVLALSIAAASMASQFIPFTYVAVMLSTLAGASANEITLIFFVFGIASVVGNHLGGRAADRFGTTPALLAGMLVLPVLFAGLPLLSYGVAVAALMLALWGMAGFSFSAPQQARLVSLAPELSGVLLALHASSLYIGQAIGAAIGAFVLETGSLADLGWVAALASLGTLALFLISRRQWPVTAPRCGRESSGRAA